MKYNICIFEKGEHYNFFTLKCLNAYHIRSKEYNTVNLDNKQLHIFFKFHVHKYMLISHHMMLSYSYHTRDYLSLIALTKHIGTINHLVHLARLQENQIHTYKTISNISRKHL